MLFRPSLKIAAKLSPRTVEILMLRYVHDYTEPEIAKLLGISRGTVAVTLFRARTTAKTVTRLLTWRKNMRPQEDDDIARLLKKSLPSAREEQEASKHVFSRLLLARTESAIAELPKRDELSLRWAGVRDSP